MYLDLVCIPNVYLEVMKYMAAKQDVKQKMLLLLDVPRKIIRPV